MTSTRVDPQRTRPLNTVQEAAGDCVVYLVARDQRVQDNHALLYAQEQALAMGVSLIVWFNLRAIVGVRAREHYTFMLNSLREVAADLAKLNIGFNLSINLDAAELAREMSTHDPSLVVCDLNPLRGPKAMQKQLANTLDCPVRVVDTHNIIPLWVTSDKEEFAAHTIRSKIHKNLEQWLVEPPKVQKHPHATKLPAPDWKAADKLVAARPSNGSKLAFKPGEAAAHGALTEFINKRLDGYAEQRNVPTEDGQSNLSPYLHFGQISALRVALALVAEAPEQPLLFERGKLASFEGKPTRMDSINALLEELVVRKELADNYCFYQPNYDNLDGAKQWAKDTLTAQADAPREHIYTQEQFAQAATHDTAWNAAQNEMIQTGKMHGYIRMYWAKKILEWTPTPDEAIKIAVYLNDHYSIDGGDPNGYTGIMWSIAGVHDRPWFERPVFGKIRYMNRGGLERRFDVEAYVARWNNQDERR